MKKGSIKNIVGYVISFLCLFLCLYITIEVIVANTNNRPPRVFNISVSYVPTESMEPTINAGDYVMFTKVSFDDVDVNDIVVYRASDSRFIIHRVIEKTDNYLVCKGDNNPIEDKEVVTSSMLYGRYVTTLGFMQIFTGGINKNLIFFILIIIFILMMIMQGVSIYIKGKTDDVKKTHDEEMKMLREELKKEILEEELKKLRDKKNEDGE